MTMLALSFPDWLQHFENGILLYVNGLHTPFLDVFMRICSDRMIWLPLYATLLWLFFIKQGGRFTIISIVVLSIVIYIADQTAVHVIRNIIPRMRPSNPQNPIEPMVHLVNGYRSGKYGFPSAHAGNVTALAVYCAWMFRSRLLTWTLVAWALIVMYSRMYLGVHYLGDIIGGAILGTTAATVLYCIQKRFIIRNNKFEVDVAESMVIATSIVLSLLIAVSFAALKVTMG